MRILCRKKQVIVNIYLPVVCPFQSTLAVTAEQRLLFACGSDALALKEKSSWH